MVRPTRYFLALLPWLLAGCPTVPNPDYCEPNVTECGTGLYCNPATNACEPSSTGEECSAAEPCNAGAPICDTGTSMCRGCNSAAECMALDPVTPVCTDTGQCVAGEVRCSGPADCAGDPSKPYCDAAGDGTCKGCGALGGDEYCTDLGAGTDYCATGGACVACLDESHCDATAPVCGADNACSACTEHGDCADYSGVCDRDSGACVPEDAIAYVKKEGGSDSAPCTKAQPCLTIDAALDQLRADNEAKSVVRILDGETYGENLSLGDITAQIIGGGAAIERPTGVNDTPVINISDNADIALEELTIRGATGGTNADGIRCGSLNTPSTVSLLRVTIRENGDHGVEAIQCGLTVERSVVTANIRGGIEVNNASFDITNSFLVGNGSVDATLGGVRISNGDPEMPQRFAFNTVAQNVVGSDASAGGVECDVNTSSELIATSNIILEGLGGKPAVAGTCTWHYSNIENGDQLGGIASMDNGNLYDDCGLTGSDGVMSIAAGTPCEDAAEPDTGIGVDYEGDPRPQDAPDVGADEIVSDA